MPLYDYRCQDCGSTHTVHQRYSDNSTPHCSECKSRNMKRIISSFFVTKSKQERVNDLSWVDKNLAGRIKKKASRKLNPALKETVERMELD